jgi:hypothetical protein
MIAKLAHKALLDCIAITTGVCNFIDEPYYSYAHEDKDISNSGIHICAVVFAICSRL